MKKLILALALAAFPLTAKASPYFRILQFNNLSSYQPVGGNFVDIAGSAQPLNGAMIPLIYHNHTDGTFLIPGEDWSLLNVGGASGPNGNVVAIGPMWNLAQSAEYMGSIALNYLTPASSLANVKAALSPAQPSSLDLSAAAGPVFLYDPVTRKGYFRFFLGGALHF